jgi:hypothetical protein
MFTAVLLVQLATHPSGIPDYGDDILGAGVEDETCAFSTLPKN